MTLSPSEIRVKDPLAEITRRERKALLGVCALGIAIVHTELVPTKITALGITFTETDQQSLLNVIALIVGYFLVAFVTLASSDFIAWRLAYRNAVDEEIVQQELAARISGSSGVPSSPKEIEAVARARLRHPDRRSFWPLAARVIGWLRTLFEFFVPIVVAIYAIILLAQGIPETNGQVSVEGQEPTTPVEHQTTGSSLTLELLGTTDSFAPGMDCPVALAADAGLEQAIEALRDRSSEASAIVVVGSADVEPVRNRLRQRFGNNIGLAQERARCVQTVIRERTGMGQLPIYTFSRAPRARGLGLSDEQMAGDRTVDVLLATTGPAPPAAVR